MGLGFLKYYPCGCGAINAFMGSDGNHGPIFKCETKHRREKER